MGGPRPQGVPVARQQQAPSPQTLPQTVEFPQLQYIGKVDFRVPQQRNETIHIPVFVPCERPGHQFVDSVVGVPDVSIGKEEVLVPVSENPSQVRKQQTVDCQATVPVPMPQVDMPQSQDVDQPFAPISADAPPIEVGHPTRTPGVHKVDFFPECDSSGAAQVEDAAVVAPGSDVDSPMNSPHSFVLDEFLESLTDEQRQWFVQKRQVRGGGQS